MSETPRTDAARQDEHDPYMAVASECSKMEKELNAANKLIQEIEKSGVYEGRPINTYTGAKEDEPFHSIECCTSSTASKIDMDLIDTENHNQQNQEELKARIQHLEDIINRAHLAFFSDSSDRKVSIAMHRILDEEVRKESQ